MNYAKIRSFTDLLAWQKGHALVLDIYKFSELFPTKEQFSLTNQLRRSSVSITSNLAEGFSRQSTKEKIQFYYISLGSTTEVQNQLLIARDLGYLDKDTFNVLAEQTIVVSKLINRLIKGAKKLNS